MEDILATMRARHAVRQYLDQPIDKTTRAALQRVVDLANQEGDLHMQLLFDEPECFTTGRSRYGKFSGVANYIAVVGRKADDLEQRAGYYGERVVLEMQAMGLNSCWVALTHGATKAHIGPGEKLVIVIAFGYGATQGVPHKSRPLTDLYEADETPDWFLTGMEAAQLAPTAVNQQRFRISYKDGQLTARPGFGPCTRIDLGIAEYHFTAASGHRFS